MRWICKDDVEECLTQSWRDSAKMIARKIADAENSAARRKILKSESCRKVWREYYKLLPEAIKKKCWYCEASEIRSDRPIDHFRPKGGVAEDSEHEGYWWLACEWENYRCACTYCNSHRKSENSAGGKQESFPLLDVNNRACCPEDDLDREAPGILDPFDPDDEKVLWFDNDGVPTCTAGACEHEQEKVKNSTRIFHLDEVRIVRERNKIRLTVQKHVDRIKRSPNSREAKDAKALLKRMVRDTEILSRATIVYLRPYRVIPEIARILDLD